MKMYGAILAPGAVAVVREAPGASWTVTTP
jgi:hypothetical protein